MSRAVIAGSLGLFIFLPPAFAVALGEAEVKSKMGQSFEAHVPIIATEKELFGITVAMAPGEQYAKLGVDYEYFLRHITGEVVTSEDGRSAYFRLFSRTPFYQPKVRIILEATWPEGRSYRAYTLLLNPSENVFDIARSVTREGAGNRRLQGEVRVINEDEPPPPPPPIRNRAYAPETMGQVSGDGYRVMRGDTLAGIARRAYQGGATLDQVMIAIQEANPGKFINNNINLLPTGVTLIIPSSQAIESLPPQVARSKVRNQSSRWRSGGEMSNDNAPKDRVSISTGSSEETIAKKKELDDINSRIEELKKKLQQQEPANASADSKEKMEEKVNP